MGFYMYITRKKMPLDKKKQKKTKKKQKKRLLLLLFLICVCVQRHTHSSPNNLCSQLFIVLIKQFCMFVSSAVVGIL